MRASFLQQGFKLGDLGHIIAYLLGWHILELGELEQLGEVDYGILIVMELLVRFTPEAVSLNQNFRHSFLLLDSLLESLL